MPVVVKKESFVLKISRCKRKNKFSFIVPNQEIKKATDRNLLKRRMRDIIKRHIFKTDKNLCYVFYMNKNALRTKFSSLEKNVISAINVSGNNN